MTTRKVTEWENELTEQALAEAMAVIAQIREALPDLLQCSDPEPDYSIVIGVTFDINHQGWEGEIRIPHATYMGDRWLERGLPHSLRRLGDDVMVAYLRRAFRAAHYPDSVVPQNMITTIKQRVHEGALHDEEWSEPVPTSEIEPREPVERVHSLDDIRQSLPWFISLSEPDGDYSIVLTARFDFRYFAVAEVPIRVTFAEYTAQHWLTRGLVTQVTRVGQQAMREFLAALLEAERERNRRKRDRNSRNGYREEPR